MKKSGLIMLAFAMIFVCGSMGFSQTGLEYGTIFPTPHDAVVTDKKVYLVKDSKTTFQIRIENSSPQTDLAKTYIEQEIKKYFKEAAPQKNISTRIILDVIQDCSRLGSDRKNFDEGDKEILEDKNNTGQSYVLKTVGNDVFIASKTSLGVLYGTMSLLQLFRKEENDLYVPGLMIRDYPDFKYRASADFLLNGEIQHWAYDWGDGVENYAGRIKRKLEHCLRYKINFVYFDGFSFDAYQRFPGICDRMKELNKYARARGIHLEFGGFENMDLKNRTQYPSGKEYECGQVRSDFRKQPADLGTCYSNDELTKQRQKRIERFVGNFEPGALYIHTRYDLSQYGHLTNFWAARCPECKKRWPSDVVEDPNGFAGAAAYMFNKLAEAISKVENPETGYKASRDCLIVFVGPGYGGGNETDENFDRLKEYWIKVSNAMNYKDNMEFCFREMLTYKDGRKKYKVLSEDLNKKGKGHGIHGWILSGADLMETDLLFAATPIIDKTFEGAECIYNANGGVFQEPQMVLNVEYAWNFKANGFFVDYENRSQDTETYGKYRRNQLEPEQIFGEKGFLGIACRKLYGEEAGQWMYKVNRLETETFAPEKRKRGPLDIMAVLYYFDGWICKPGAQLPEKMDEELVKFEKIQKITQEAAGYVSNALNSKDLNLDYQPDLVWQLKCLRLGDRMLEFLKKFARFYQQYAQRGKDKTNDGELKETLNSVKQDFSALDKYFKDNFSYDVCYSNCGDPFFTKIALEGISGRINQLVAALDDKSKDK